VARTAMSTLKSIFTIGVLSVGTAAGDSNTELGSATYEGSSGNDEMNAVDIAPDGTVVFGGAMGNEYPVAAQKSGSLLGGGTGVVGRLDKNTGPASKGTGSFMPRNGGRHR
jgi:hypothetical protein